MSSKENPATPRFARGEVVIYRDHHERVQQGAVLSADARWPVYGGPPYIVYTLRHPTYRNRCMYAGDSSIIGLVP